MEVTVRCIRLLINILMLLVAEDQHQGDAAFLRMVPNRLQLFEFDSVFIDCKGCDDYDVWRVMRRTMGVKTVCTSEREKSEGCFIKNAFESDSGEYWCEAEGTGRSSSVHISVTAGSVILEIPALPVMEGENVSLHCRNKTNSSVPIADFYKDGTKVWTGYKGSMTINNVSKSDEGLYKCKIIGGGESAESWLTVRAAGNEIRSTATPGAAYREETPLPDSHSPRVFTSLWIVVTVVVVAPLLILVVVLHYMKHKDENKSCTTVAYYTLSTGSQADLSYCNSSSVLKYQPTSK